MNNLNNSNTVIENVEYLDMDDKNNSWYFDAERFDVNFPLVRSYRSQVRLYSEFFQEWYEYWDAVFSYYSVISNTFGICFTMDTPSAFSDLNDRLNLLEGDEYPESEYRTSSRVNDAFPSRKLFLYSKQTLSNGKRVTYVLAVVKNGGCLIELRKKLLQSFFLYSK